MYIDNLSRRFQLFLAVVIFFNIALWFAARPLKAEWQNVPPPPSDFGARAMGYGDDQLAYRAVALMLQNLGNSGGRFVPLKTYDYEALKGWLFQAYELDRRAAHIPILAAYYFGATRQPEQIRHIIDFLKVAGRHPEGERWRWLVRAVFLARHRLEDLDLALHLAQLLKTHENPGIPLWARHMEAMVKNARGEKEDAYEMLRALLDSSAGDLHPTEVSFIVHFICEQVLNPEEAAAEPLCRLQTR